MCPCLLSSPLPLSCNRFISQSAWQTCRRSRPCVMRARCVTAQGAARYRRARIRTQETPLESLEPAARASPLSQPILAHDIAP